MDLLSKIFEAGVVGCGGAGFPTHIKLNAQPEYFIVNGAECEPLLRTDRYIMTNMADRIVAGVDAICDGRKIPKRVIALKAHYRREREALGRAIRKAGSGIELHLMDSFYPAGDEQIVVYEVTRRVVPSGGIPLAVGAVVDNVATVLAVADALEGRPFTHKYLTVTGEVKRPVILRVPVGTGFDRCIALAGGTDLEDCVIVSGGPAMGRYMDKEEGLRQHVTKTTSGILVLPSGDGAYNTGVDRMLSRAASACIQCSFCTQMCPRHMLGHPIRPHKIMRKMSMYRDFSRLLEDEDIRQAALCCECGVCELYACPMGLLPRTVNSLLKQELGRAKLLREGGKEDLRPDPNRSLRKVPAKRLAARAGVLKYFDRDICDCVEDCPPQVEIPLKMHIGVSSEPTVASGDRVEAGQLIARCPQGQLGANICAGIGGTVQLRDDSIIISG